MDNNILEHRIRDRAYAIWAQNGCIDGQAHQHWLTAERELLATLTADLPAAKTTATATKTTAAKASATKSRKPRSRATPSPAMARAG
jgi:DUF2934 family protein